ncbi:hypothetical protein MHH37_05425 [Solibacillus sp. FSL K6-1781]|uniref:hypothetical protein n=1 Tax=Solibacillus sp. FSL K6-1781 TaxID=2921474 RepID=UPI00315A6F71
MEHPKKKVEFFTAKVKAIHIKWKYPLWKIENANLISQVEWKRELIEEKGNKIQQTFTQIKQEALTTYQT